MTLKGYQAFKKFVLQRATMKDYDPAWGWYGTKFYNLRIYFPIARPFDASYNFLVFDENAKKETSNSFNIGECQKIRLDGNTIKFIMTDGTEYPYPLERDAKFIRQNRDFE